MITIKDSENFSAIAENALSEVPAESMTITTLIAFGHATAALASAIALQAIYVELEELSSISDELNRACELLNRIDTNLDHMQ